MENLSRCVCVCVCIHAQLWNVLVLFSSATNLILGCMCLAIKFDEMLTAVVNTESLQNDRPAE